MNNTATVRVKQRRLCVKAPYTLKEKLAALPTARWDRHLRAWTYEPTPTTAHRINQAMFDAFCAGEIEGTDYDDNMKALLLAACCRPHNHQTVQLARGDWPHQGRAVSWLLNKLGMADSVLAQRGARCGAMLAWEMGTGKTRATLRYIERAGLRRVVVIAPYSVLHVWPREARRVWRERTQGQYQVEALESGSVAKRVKRFQAILKFPAWLVVINYEAARQERMLKALQAARPELLVLDECHRIKSPGGVTSRRLAALAKAIPRVLGLTGTPMPHSPLDIYAQLRTIDPGVFGLSAARFRARYATLESKPYAPVPVVTGYRNLEELHERLEWVAYRLRADEVLTLPPLRTTERYVVLPARVRQAYDELEHEFITWLDELGNRPIVAANVLVKVLRLQQLASSIVPVDDGEWTLLEPAKQVALAEWLEDIGGAPSVVFARFHGDLAQVRAACSKLGRPCYELSGTVKQLDDWDNDASGQAVLAVQLQAGSLGINLTKAQHAAFMSLPQSLGEYRQAIARLHRAGQGHPVVITHIVAIDTVDEAILAALRSKGEVVDFVLDELRNRHAMRQFIEACRERNKEGA